MLTALRERLRSLRRRGEERREKDAVDAFVLEHEEAERESRQPTVGIPPMRNNTDWSGFSGPL
jgi:hypothetical protein